MKTLWICWVLASITLAGCAKESYFTKDFELNRPGYANVGASLIQWEEGSRAKKSKTISEAFRHELLYSGLQGRTTFITYREYWRSPSGEMLARPAFSQDLKYELGQDGKTIITFRDIRIEVLEATNERIGFQVLQGPSTPLPPAEPDQIAEEKVNMYPKDKRRLVSVTPTAGAAFESYLVGESVSRYYFSPDKEAKTYQSAILKTLVSKMDDKKP